MSALPRNIFAVLAGLVVGSIVNMALVVAGPAIIPPPAGVDMADTESLAASIDLLGPQHFIFPFLAHASGTLAGAATTYLLAASKKMNLAFVIGGFFLLGGITASTMIPAPTWFIALDLVAAYLPMAWLGTVLGSRFARGAN